MYFITCVDNYVSIHSVWSTKCKNVFEEIEVNISHYNALCYSLGYKL